MLTWQAFARVPSKEKRALKILACGGQMSPDSYRVFEAKSDISGQDIYMQVSENLLEWLKNVHQRQYTRHVNIPVNRSDMACAVLPLGTAILYNRSQFLEAVTKEVMKGKTNDSP
jgi:hypothetical protein